MFERGKFIAGFEVVEHKDFFTIVKGDLICEKCKNKFNDLIAVNLNTKESVFCIYCFFEKCKNKDFHGNGWIHFCPIKNKRIEV